MRGELGAFTERHALKAEANYGKGDREGGPVLLAVTRDEIRKQRSKAMLSSTSVRQRPSPSVVHGLGDPRPAQARGGVRAVANGPGLRRESAPRPPSSAPAALKPTLRSAS